MKYFTDEVLLMFKELKEDVESIKTLIGKETSNPFQEKKLLTVEEVADLLSVSTSTIYQRVSRRELPHIKMSRRLYFDRDEVLTYLRTFRKDTLKEINDSVPSMLNHRKESLL